MPTITKPTRSWRDALPIHPAAELFPRMSPDELRALGEDIRKNGLTSPIALWRADPRGQAVLLDGRNRLDALEIVTSSQVIVGPPSIMAGEDFLACEKVIVLDKSVDPYAYVISANIYRRHLTTDQKRELIAALLKADPSKSDRQVAETVKASHHTVGTVRAEMERRGQLAHVPTRTDTKGRAQPARKPPTLPKPNTEPINGARAIMASRHEPDDSLDFFPTPPFATRAWIKRVLPVLNIRESDLTRMTAWEPGCGEGHMTEVLNEIFGRVIATDVHDYGYGETPVDFLNAATKRDSDWIITNPPFEDKAIRFVLRALQLARVGVAMFMRLQWLETIKRYEMVFRDHPPTLVSFFAERVPLCKGRWNPDGDTATAYMWLTWIKGEAPRAPFWIPPGCREQLSHVDDVARFTTHPVTRAAAATPPPPDDDGLDIPACLRRAP